jgi:hypothetical protein
VTCGEILMHTEGLCSSSGHIDKLIMMLYIIIIIINILRYYTTQSSSVLSLVCTMVTRNRI